MNRKQFYKLRLYFTGVVTIMIWSLLAWDHVHGGVPSHHILADETLPEISNWWGALLLPLLTWFLLYRIQLRIFGRNNEHSQVAQPFAQARYGFLAALVFGILLSTSFTLGYADLSGYILLSLFPLALFYPIYRAECLLGFVLGMSYTFGAVLPSGIGTILALIGFVLYRVIRGGFLFLVAKFSLVASVKKQKPIG